MNEKTAVEDFERKVYRVEAVQPCGRSLVLNQLAVWRLGSVAKKVFNAEVAHTQYQDLNP